jgi:hypothetical protein
VPREDGDVATTFTKRRLDAATANGEEVFANRQRRRGSGSRRVAAEDARRPDGTIAADATDLRARREQFRLKREIEDRRSRR